MSQLPLADIIQERKDELGLSVNQIAVAAGLHKTTVYRILRGVTTDPRPRTLRKLARALHLSITDLTNEIVPQGLEEHFDPDHPLAELLVQQFDVLPDNLKLAGAAASVSAMLDVEAGLGNSEGGRLAPDLDRLLRREWEPNASDIKRLLRRLFHRIPRLLQRTAVREAVRAMIDVQLRLGEPPSSGTYRVAADSRLQPTPSWLKKRQLRIWGDEENQT